MATDDRSPEDNKPGRKPLTPAQRARLEKLFEHAGKKMAAGEFDYASELLSQCVTGHPGNAIYAQAFIDNLQKKYNNNKKGSPLAQFKERGARSALKKALAEEKWDAAIEHGVKVLVVNPWDMSTLVGMATAANKMEDRDCELCYLKAALMGDPKDINCNRLFALAMTDRGLIDQAITWWHRVEELSSDSSSSKEEARRAVAVLTVQKARSRGEYDDDETSRKLRVRDQKQQEATLEQRLQQKIQAEPKNIATYLELSQLYINDERYKECEELLAQAFEMSDGDPDIREKWEDAQLRRLRQKLAAAKDPVVKKKLQQEYFEKDMEACKARVERFPSNLAFKFELGYRYMLTKRYAEAIRELQVAKNDPRKKGLSLLVLGQCFEHIKQYRLGMSHYEAAIQEIPDREADNKKRALYRAGRLAMGLKDLETAEKHLTTLAGLDFTYKDVSALLDKIAKLRDNPGFESEGSPSES